MSYLEILTLPRWESFNVMLQNYDVRGRIYISEQGINAQVT